ncbi:hypothetical protein SELMODRAFT_267148 [Selaginella moellendorffii]|uniref:Uncharacterized protein n=1 Tax=Selaginella moellendorffii TaxID=88036 RepID=D8RA59_SELML|nr:GDSL esterase/lipase APG [Selaginella moellendorffii]EFJ31271.1 hypothetical protein SELMODRAFT_267148 [Selaginella moellendorffii]|eukprot:XP_002967924.1 GDSL esterase/lipase APG [Selaginella moellendorffii]
MSAASFFATLSLIASLLSSRSRASQLVPALYVFGDSSVDAGNNDYIGTVVRADFPPYGRDFDSHKATGRFSNGRVSSDYLASLLGLPLPPPYLDPSAKGSKIIQGVNFATAGSGLYEKTAALLNVPNLPRQISWFRNYKQKLVQLAGQNRTASILSKAFIVLSSGSNDYINNYYFDPALRVKYTKDAFRQVLIFSVENFVKEMYQLGARRISIAGLIPLGCIPSQVTLYGKGQLKCSEFENQDARLHNQALESSVQRLRGSMTDLRVAYIDVYTIFSKVIQQPESYGFEHTLTSCCGVGRLAVSLLCNKLTPGTCRDASKYVFWDSFHPSDAMNKILAKVALDQANAQLFH